MQIKKLNMTERTTNNGNTTTTTTARKHKKHKSSKHLMMDSSVDTGGSVGASTSNSATVCSADGGFSSEVGPAPPPPTNELAICCASSSTSSSAGTSTSTGLQSPKPLRIVLKMAQSGSYSPKLPLDNDDVGVDNAETTTNTTLNGTIDDVVNDVVNQSINYDCATNNNNVQLPLSSMSMSMSQPPQLIPLNVDSFQNEFINSMKKSKKLKKTKKKHHHHHHHHHRAQNNNDNNNVNNNFPNNNNIGDDEGQSSSSSNFFLVPESSTSISVSSNSVQLPSMVSNIEDSNVNTANHLLQFNHQSMSMNNGYVNQSQQQLKSSTIEPGFDYRNGPEVMTATTKIEIANSKNCQQPNPALLLSSSSQNETTDVNINPIISSSSSSSSKYSQLQRNVTFSTSVAATTTTANQSPPKNYSLYRRLLQNGTVKYHANNIGQQRPNYLRNSIYSTKHQQQSLKKLSQFQQFLHHLLGQLRAKDLQKFFAFPPSDLLEPGYSGVVQNPMDFNTMGKKIDYGLYESVYEMKFDCRVLCENALRYYPQSSVQYREAARLWHFAKTKVFHRDAIAEVRRTLFPKLTNAEIGLESFSPPMSSTNNNPHATEGKLIKLELNSKSTLSNGINNNNEPRPLPQTALHALLTDVKIEPNSIEGRHQNGMKYHSEDVNNDEDYKLTPQQLFQNARKYLGNNTTNLEDANYHESKFTVDRPSGDHLSMLRQHSDGSTTLGLLSSLNGVDCDEISRLLLDDNSGSSVNIGRLVGKLNEGTTVLCPPYKEPEMYRIRPVQYFNDPLLLPHQPGNNNNNKPSVHRASFQYCSHLPFLDSSKATINLDDSSLLFNTFGEDGTDGGGGEHQKAIDEVANNPDFMIPFVDSVLDIVSNGEYSKQAKISEDDVVPVDDDELDDSTTTIDADETKELLTSNESAEVDRLKITESSEDLCDAIVQQQLNEIDNLLQQLRTIQYRRLSKTTEPVSPDEREQEIAAQISKQLVKLIGDCSVPGQIADVEAIHKAMGIVIEDDDGDGEDNNDLMQCFVEDNTTTTTTTQSQQQKPLQEPEIVSMDLD